MRSLRVWFGILVAVLVVSIALTSIYSVPGNANDPLPAELGNALGPAAVVGLVVLAVIAIIRWRRTRTGREGS